MDTRHCINHLRVLQKDNTPNVYKTIIDEISIDSTLQAELIAHLVKQVAKLEETIEKLNKN